MLLKKELTDKIRNMCFACFMHKNKNIDRSSFCTTAPSNMWMVDFMSTTRPVLFSVLLDMVDKDEAEEIAQEAYLKVFIAMKADRVEKPSAFLLKVAKNFAISKLRHKKVENNHALNVSGYVDIQPTPQIKPDEIIDENARNQILISAINQLPPACRQVFIYRKLEDKSHAEIAKLMQISTKTVENHLSKGMLLCRKYLLENKTMQDHSEKGLG